MSLNAFIEIFGHRLSLPLLITPLGTSQQGAIVIIRQRPYIGACELGHEPDANSGSPDMADSLTPIS